MIKTDIRPEASAQLNGVVFATLLLGPSLRIVEVNPAAEQLFQRSARRLIDEQIWAVIDPDNPRISEAIFASDAPVVARDVPVHISGRSRRVNITYSPLHSHPGWAVMTLSDAGLGELEGDDDRDLSLHAPAVLAHEIKNPLAAIRGASQLLGRKLGADGQALTQVITDEVDRIASLIDRMQKLGSKTPLPAAPFNMHEAIRQAIKTIQTAFAPPVPLVEEFDPSLPPVMGNREAFEQIMINLLGNAHDACSGQAEPVVIVRTRFVSGLALSALRLDQAIRLPIEISVSDNGPGVPPELREHIFEPFVTTKVTGQGLGLALVRKMVRDMDGRITCKRDERKQLTRFRIHLPVAADTRTHIS